MSIVTSQQISRYYDLYKTVDVTLTREVMKITGLDAPHVYLKCLGEQWPCVVYSTSFQSAKIITSSRPVIMDKFKKANNLVNLRFSFKRDQKAENLSFFVSSKILGFAPYAQGQDLQFVTLNYTQRPPDDLIEIMGRLLEANMNSTRRKDERITITPDTIRKLGIVSKECIVYVQGVPRRCILRDLSFSGAKIILVGMAKFLVGKESTLRLELEDPRETVEIKGMTVRYEEVEGRSDLVALALRFEEATVPMTLKVHLSDYLMALRKNLLADSEKTVELQKKKPADKGEAPAGKADAQNGAAMVPGAATEQAARVQAGAATPTGSGAEESFAIPEEEK